MRQGAGHPGQFAEAGAGFEAGGAAAARALLAVALAAVAPDGLLDPGRLARVLAALDRLPSLAPLPFELRAAAARGALRRLAASGAGPVLAAAAAALPERLRETALCLAVAAALADGSIGGREKTMLPRLAEALGVPLATFAIIVEVMAMLHRRAA